MGFWPHDHFVTVTQYKKPEAGNRMPETGSQSSDFGNKSNVYMKFNNKKSAYRYFFYSSPEFACSSIDKSSFIKIEL